MKKKLITISIIMIAILSLFGCSQKETDVQTFSYKGQTISLPMSFGKIKEILKYDGKNEKINSNNLMLTTYDNEILGQFVNKGKKTKLNNAQVTEITIYSPENYTFVSNTKGTDNADVIKEKLKKKNFKNIKSEKKDGQLTITCWNEEKGKKKKKEKIEFQFDKTGKKMNLVTIMSSAATKTKSDDMYNMEQAFKIYDEITKKDKLKKYKKHSQKDIIKELNTFNIDGKKLVFPMTVKELKNNGFIIEEKDNHLIAKYKTMTFTIKTKENSKSLEEQEINYVKIEENNLHGVKVKTIGNVSFDTDNEKLEDQFLYAGHDDYDNSSTMNGFDNWNSSFKFSNKKEKLNLVWKTVNKKEQNYFELILK